MKLDVLKKKNAEQKQAISDLARRAPHDVWWNPFELFEDRLFPRLGENGWFPKMDISETPQRLQVKMNVPGVNPQDISVEADDNSLTVSGKTQKEKEEEGETFYRLEREEGSFQRTFSLPKTVDTDKIQVFAKDGTLTIIAPKKESTQKRKIPVG